MVPKDLQVQRAIADKENSELMRVAKMKEGIFKPSMPDPMPSMLPSKASAPTGVIKKMFNKHQHIYSKVIIRYILEIKTCGLGSRIRDVEAFSNSLA